MIEHYTEGIVLDKSPRGGLDGAVTIYTKDLGKVTAFTKSSRKITSKISGHIMPGNLVRLRIVENKTIQAMDALSEKPKCDMQELLPFLQFLNEVIPHGDADINFWNLINEVIKKCHFKPETYRYILEILGFGADDAICGNCKRNEIAYFSLPDIMFLCTGCAKRHNLRANEFVEI